MLDNVDQGITTKTVALPAYANWGTFEPAVRVKDSDLAHRILAADEVFYSGGPVSAWDAVTRYRINHRSRSDPTRPALQNILYADGHVEATTEKAYASGLTITNFSITHFTNGAFFYWRRP